MVMGGAKEELVVGVIAIVLIITVFVVISTAQFVDCPVCKNHEPEKFTCSACGRDGKVTLLQYLSIIFARKRTDNHAFQYCLHFT